MARIDNELIGIIGVLYKLGLTVRTATIMGLAIRGGNSSTYNEEGFAKCMESEGVRNPYGIARTAFYYLPYRSITHSWSGDSYDTSYFTAVFGDVYAMSVVAEKEPVP